MGACEEKFDALAKLDDLIEFTDADTENHLKSWSSPFTVKRSNHC